MTSALSPTAPLLDDLLELTRIMQGKLQLRKQACWIDRAFAKRAFETMMGMKKIDIAAIEAVRSPPGAK